MQNQTSAGVEATSSKTHLEILHDSWKKQVQIIIANIERLTQKKNSLYSDLEYMSQDIYGTPYVHKFGIWGTIGWLLVLIVVAYAEYPLNASAFEVFDRSQNETTLLAIAFGIIVAITAHFSGFSWKRVIVTGKWHFVLVGLLLVSAALSGLYITSLLRFDYLREMNGQPMSVLMQWAFSVGIFFVGFVVSFFHSSSAKNLVAEKSYKQKLNSHRKIEKEILKYENQLHQIEDEFNKKIHDLQSVDKARKGVVATDDIFAKEIVQEVKSPDPVTKPTDILDYKGWVGQFLSRLEKTKSVWEHFKVASDKNGYKQNVVLSFGNLKTAIEEINELFKNMKPEDRKKYFEDVEGMRSEFDNLEKPISDEILK